MGQGLFRQEVVDASRHTWLGSVQATPPLSRWIIVLLALVFSSLVLAVLLFGKYRKRAHVSGSLVPDAGLLNIEANLTGSVSHVWVKEGQKVEAGQYLVGLSGDSNSPVLGDVHADITRRLREQKKRLEVDLNTLHESMALRRRELKDQLALFTAQRKQLESESKLEAQQADSDRLLLKRIEPLGGKGYVSAIQIERQRALVLQDQLRIKRLNRQYLSLAQKVSAVRLKLSQLPRDLSSKVNSIERELDNIGQRLARNESERSTVLRAPVSGVITSMLVVPGQAVRKGIPLLSILPSHTRLEAQLFVPSRAIGFVDRGSRVVLRYRAYPYQKFGQQFGHVSLVSNNALAPSQIYALGGEQTNQPLYRVKVRLESQVIQTYGESKHLKPGMTLDADILLERRSLMEWVFEPLYGVRERLAASEVPHG